MILLSQKPRFFHNFSLQKCLGRAQINSKSTALPPSLPETPYLLESLNVNRQKSAVNIFLRQFIKQTTIAIK